MRVAVSRPSIFDGRLLLLACAVTWTAGYRIAKATPPDPVLMTREAPLAYSRPSAGRIVASTTTSPDATATTCAGTPPGPSWTCQNGVWQTGPAPSSGDGAGGGGAGRTAGGCATETPGPSFVCQSGTWTLPVPEGPMQAAAVAPRADQNSSSTPGGCAALPPAADWVCTNGVWAPSQPAVGAPPVAQTPAPLEPATNPVGTQPSP